jgi:hypothetical protein
VLQLRDQIRLPRNGFLQLHDPIRLPPDQGGKLITGRTRIGEHRDKIRKPRRQLKSTRSTQSASATQVTAAPGE